MKKYLRACLVFSLLLLPVAAPAQSAVQDIPQNTHQTPTDVEQELERGLQALRNEDWATGMRILMPLAQAGHPQAQALVGHMHQNGLGVQKDLAEGVRWFTRSAVQGFPDSLFTLGQMYYQGEGVPEDLVKAADLFFLTAVSGDADGMWAIGVCFTYGEGREQNPIEGCAWLLMSANQGQPNAQEELNKLRPQLSDQDFGQAEAIAETLSEMIVKGQIDPAKLPPVPVPDFMRDEFPNGPVRLDAPAPVDTQQSTPTEAAEIFVGHMEIEGEMLATGDLSGKTTVALPPELYQEFKRTIPDTKILLRDLTPSRANLEMRALLHV